MTARVFLDSSVLLYAFGGPHEHRQSSLDLMSAAAGGRCVLHLSVEAIQEFVFHRMRRGATGTAVLAARRLGAAAVLHPFDVDVLQRSLGLMESTPIRGRDAVHAATALVQGFDQIVTTDRDFAQVSGLEVIDPAAAHAGL
ncbi:type II toxin-antitoxin system VapC family toxin [Nocardioides plantarum]|uniref:Ribonuclease VapC n=1 Tax=Nocardioides plantarum TaxID=29299 RepID=A0ABV5KB60_9ACTN|nr:type II toxin-antitoxin system VapC family toxin [Nocardioides plantarum]